jgi:GNAT superfamily N-acetyltransferase
MKITRKTNKDECFYGLIGPFLARREIEREIGYKIYDDDEKQWLIAIDTDPVTHNIRVIGFCYVLAKSKDHYQVGSCYVIEDYRHKGVFKKLLIEACSGIKGTVSLVTKNKNLITMLTKERFVRAGARGSFIEFRKEFKGNV